MNDVPEIQEPDKPSAAEPLNRFERLVLDAFACTPIQSRADALAELSAFVAEGLRHNTSPAMRARLERAAHAVHDLALEPAEAA
jgi:hypothetical protein